MTLASQSGHLSKCRVVCSMLHIASSTSNTRRVCCSQVKQAELEAKLEELRAAIAHQSQLDEASKQEEAWLRQLLLPSQSQVCWANPYPSCSCQQLTTTTCDYAFHSDNSAARIRSYT